VRRGELYRVRRPGGDDPRKSRVFLVVSREAVIESGFASVICTPVYSHYDGLATQVEVGPEHGLKHPCGATPWSACPRPALRTTSARSAQNVLRPGPPVYASAIARREERAERGMDSVRAMSSRRGLGTR